MNLRRIPAFSLVALTVCVSTGSVFAAPARATSDDSGVVSQFELTDKTQVPGHVLKAGSYIITVIDSLSDRMVLRVYDAGGKEVGTFLGLPGVGRIPVQSRLGPIAMNTGSGGKAALRGFAFPNGLVAEFVYPKAEAVSLAKANSTTVPAIDPASEGRPDSPDLSRKDMELVTLWMLTPTVVGSQAAIEAKRYQQVAEAAPPPLPRPTPAPRPEISATPPPASPAPAAPPAVSAVPQPPSPTPASRPEVSATPPHPALPQVAAAGPAAFTPKPRHVAHPIAALPHTASNLPLVMLAGLISLMGAALLRLRRQMTSI